MALEAFEKSVTLGTVPFNKFEKVLSTAGELGAKEPEYFFLFYNAKKIYYDTESLK